MTLDDATYLDSDVQPSVAAVAGFELQGAKLRVLVVPVGSRVGDGPCDGAAATLEQNNTNGWTLRVSTARRHPPDAPPDPQPGQPIVFCPFVIDHAPFVAEMPAPSGLVAGSRIDYEGLSTDEIGTQVHHARSRFAVEATDID